MANAVTDHDGSSTRATERVSGFEKLPPEIVTSILRTACESADQRDLASFAKVSRLFLAMARPLLYRSILIATESRDALGNHRIPLDFAGTLRLFRTFREEPSKVHLVQSVSVRGVSLGWRRPPNYKLWQEIYERLSYTTKRALDVLKVSDRATAHGCGSTEAHEVMVVLILVQL